MVVKSQIRLIKSLQQKKYRNQHQLFVVEGIKAVNELLASSIKPYMVYTTATHVLENISHSATQISSEILHKMSGLRTPSPVLGVFHIPESKPITFTDWIVVLDAIRDPGNLGTIIRLCDWFGVSHIVCSNDTVDAYNPKVLQATMGSIARVNLVYTDLPFFLKESSVPVYGAFMNGAKVYEEKMPEKGLLIIGNEANGISKEVAAFITKKIHIPQFGLSTAESLNAATATAILLHELRRA